MYLGESQVHETVVGGSVHFPVNWQCWRGYSAASIGCRASPTARVFLACVEKPFRFSC